MNHKYAAVFNLFAPIQTEDFKNARAYLAEPDMTEILKDHIEYAVSRGEDAAEFPDPDQIVSIEWKLFTSDSGAIVLRTEEELNSLQLQKVSEFVSGQNADGIGEGFEQTFAYFEEGYYEDEDNWEEDIEIMPSFDWQDNNYIFVEV